jgi:hypothetical protein
VAFGSNPFDDVAQFREFRTRAVDYERDVTFPPAVWPGPHVRRPPFGVACAKTSPSVIHRVLMDTLSFLS